MLETYLVGVGVIITGWVLKALGICLRDQWQTVRKDAAENPEKYSFRAAMKLSRPEDWSAMVAGPFFGALAVYVIVLRVHGGIPDMHLPPNYQTPVFGALGLMHCALAIPVAMTARRRPHRELRTIHWMFGASLMLMGIAFLLCAIPL